MLGGGVVIHFVPLAQIQEAAYGVVGAHRVVNGAERRLRGRIAILGNIERTAADAAHAVDVIMRDGGHFLLRDQYFAAHRAVRPLGKACMHTCGGHGGIHHPRVGDFGNRALRHQHRTAHRAVLAFGQALFGTGGRHIGIHRLGMTRGGDILAEHRAARTGTCALTGRGAGGRGHDRPFAHRVLMAIDGDGVHQRVLAIGHAYVKGIDAAIQ